MTRSNSRMLTTLGAPHTAAMLLVLVGSLAGCQPHEPTGRSPIASQITFLSPADPPTAEASAVATTNSPPESTGAGAATETATETAAAPPVRPPSRRPTAPGQPIDISFDDLVIGIQANLVYREWMMKDRAKELDGQLVKVVGYVHGGVDKPNKLHELVLLRNKECKFGPDGQADHLIQVKFKPGVTAHYTENAVEVQGVLKINPWQGSDGNTWSLYDLEGTAFKDLKRK